MGLDAPYVWAWPTRRFVQPNFLFFNGKIAGREKADVLGVEIRRISRAWTDNRHSIQEVTMDRLRLKRTEYVLIGTGLGFKLTRTPCHG